MRLEELGIPVVEHCNLNCKGCLHFCHIGQEKHFYDIDEYEKNIQRLKELFEEIGIIRLYGGEPLLHPNLKDFIEVTNKKYPYSKIEILTNGILLDSMPKDLTNYIVKYGVKICWSIYPVIDNKKFTTVINFLKENKILYSYSRVDKFYTCFDLRGSQNRTEAFEKCSGKYCHVMRNGQISNCPAPLVGQYINKLGANIDFDDGILDIYTASSGKEILNFMQKSHTACKYCGAPRYFEWERQNGRPYLEDWKI